MYNKTLHEIAHTRVWFMEQSAFENYRRNILGNAGMHIALEDMDFSEKPTHRFRCFNMDGEQMRDLFVQRAEGDVYEEVPCKNEIDGDCEEPNGNEPEVVEEKKILFLYCRGPVTRNGDACSYGSIDYRDIMLAYKDDESVAGMVLITDTPGGSAMALDDFQQGIDAWHAAGKKSAQWIDGICASAGVAQGCQCQKIVAMHPMHEVGCIGAMMAGFTMKDGDTNSITQERFMYLVAEQTPDKNLEFRKAAEGDYSLLQADINECGQHFLDTIERCRPQIPQDMRTGKMYKAKDCIGTLIDGIGDLDSVCNWILTGEETWETKAPNPQPLSPVGQGVTNEPTDGCEPKKDDGCDPKKDDKCKPEDGCDPKKDDENNNSDSQGSSNNNKTMKVYSNINAAAGLEALAVTEDGSFYCNAPIAEALESKLAEAKQNAELLKANEEATAALNAKVAELNEQIATLTNEKAALEESVSNKQNAIEDLEKANTDLSAQIEENAKAVEANAQATEALNATIAQKDEEIKALNNTLAQKDAEIAEMAEAQNAAPQPQQPQQTEGNPVVSEKPTNVFSNCKTPAERRAAQNARLAQLSQQHHRK